MILPDKIEFVTFLVVKSVISTGSPSLYKDRERCNSYQTVKLDWKPPAEYFNKRCFQSHGHFIEFEGPVVNLQKQIDRLELVEPEQKWYGIWTRLF